MTSIIIITEWLKGEHLDLINAYAQYDDESEEWQIRYIASSGNNMAHTRRLAMGVAVGNLQDSDMMAEAEEGDDNPGRSMSKDGDDVTQSNNRKLKPTKGRPSRSIAAFNRPDPYVRF